MNIEQIKKDWEQHCEEFGCTPYIFGLEGIEINLSTTGFEGYMLNVSEDNRITIKPNGIIENPSTHYVYCAFYEKLMKGESDE